MHLVLFLFLEDERLNNSDICHMNVFALFHRMLTFHFIKMSTYDGGRPLRQHDPLTVEKTLLFPISNNCVRGI